MAAKVATFQERFNELLNASPKSRSTIANEFGVAKQTISAWATGQSSPRTPVTSSLAEYFGVSLAWLVGYDVPKTPKRKFDLQLFGYDPEEERLINGYRSLSPRGKDLLLDRCEELKVLYGKKPEDHTAESV